MSLWQKCNVKTIHFYFKFKIVQKFKNAEFCNSHTTQLNFEEVWQCLNTILVRSTRSICCDELQCLYCYLYNNHCIADLQQSKLISTWGLLLSVSKHRVKCAGANCWHSDEHVRSVAPSVDKLQTSWCSIVCRAVPHSQVVPCPPGR